MPTNPAPRPGDNAERWMRLQRVVDDCIDRRLSGQEVSDDRVIADHPDLMPELAAELNHLAFIDRARRRAGSGGAAEDSGPTLGADGASFPDSPPADHDPAYQVLAELRRDGGVVVVHAIHDSSDREVVIKTLRPAPDAAACRGYDRLLRQAAALDSAHLILPHEWAETPGGFRIVTDFVVGDSLVAHCRRHAARHDMAATVSRLAQAAERLGTYHARGVVHGRLKPSNLLVDRGDAVRVIDWGMRVLDPASDAYVAPELLDGPVLAADPRSDVYSLGVVFTEALEGQSAAGGGAQSTAMNGELRAILGKCVEPDPLRRYPGAGELARDLRRWLAGQPVEACMDRRGYRLAKTLQRGIRRLLGQSQPFDSSTP